MPAIVELAGLVHGLNTVAEYEVGPLLLTVQEEGKMGLSSELGCREGPY